MNRTSEQIGLFLATLVVIAIWAAALSVIYNLPMIARYLEVIMTDVAVIKSECGR